MEKGRQTLLDQTGTRRARWPAGDCPGEGSGRSYASSSRPDSRKRAISRAIGVSNSTVSEAFSRLGEAGLSWPLPEGIGDAELEARLYRTRGRAVADPREPDWALVQHTFPTPYPTFRTSR